MPSELELIPGTLPSPFTCYQPLYNEMFARGAAQAPTVTGILIQDAVPAAEDHDKGWVPTAGGVPRYPGILFVWNTVLGHWVSRHAAGPADPRPQMYIGTLVALPTFDGGDAGAPGVASGPMWEQWTPITGRVPVGVGLIPGSSPAASIVSPLDTTDTLGNSGEYRHVLIDAEGAVGSHIHPFGKSNNAVGPNGDDAWFSQLPMTPVANYNGTYVTGDGTVDVEALTEADLFTLQAANGAGVISAGHNTMPPWIGVYWIRRTSRIWIVAA